MWGLDDSCIFTASLFTIVTCACRLPVDILSTFYTLDYPIIACSHSIRIFFQIILTFFFLIPLAYCRSGRSQGEGRHWGTCPITSGLCPITRPWALSPLLTPSPILIHDLGVFNIDICAIWHKIAQNDANLLKIARFCAYSKRVFITSFAVMNLSWVTFFIQGPGPIAKLCAPLLAFFWLRACCRYGSLTNFFVGSSLTFHVL